MPNLKRGLGYCPDCNLICRLFQQPIRLIMIKSLQFRLPNIKITMNSPGRLDIGSLSEENFGCVSDAISLIKGELEIQQSEDLVVNFAPGFHESIAYEQEDLDYLSEHYNVGFMYLRNIGAIKDFSTLPHQFYSEITLDLEKFRSVSEEITEIKGKSTKHDRVSGSSSDLVWRNLKINTVAQTMQYRNGSAVEISLTTNRVKLLVMLMRKRGEVVEYIDIAKALDLNCCKTNSTNADVAREVQFIRRDLIKFLKEKIGMEKAEIDKMIIVKMNDGYRLGNE